MPTSSKQMSESLLIGISLALCGGFLDAYTYLIRDGVFANAQTGNIVLLGVYLIRREWVHALYYFIPILSFALGVLLVLTIRDRMRDSDSLHWRQIVLALEICLLLFVAFLPQKNNMLANIMVSFTCAIQVEGFRKIRGVACATTMCTGNLRSGTELLWNYNKSGDRSVRRRGLYYYSIDIAFLIGAMIGALMTRWAAEKAVLFVCIVLAGAFAVMFWEEDKFTRE